MQEVPHLPLGQHERGGGLVPLPPWPVGTGHVSQMTRIGNAISCEICKVAGRITTKGLQIPHKLRQPD